MNTVFKIIVAIASIVILVVAGLFAYSKYDESIIVRVKNPQEITLQKVNHLSSGTSLVFTSVAKNNSDINWLNFGVIIRVLAFDGTLLRRCESVYFNRPFLSGSIDIEVVCPNMPLEMPQYTYEVTTVGERY